MADLAKIVAALEKAMGDVDEILKDKKARESAAIAALKKRAIDLRTANEAFRQEIIDASGRILEYEEYHAHLQPVWGALHAARASLATGDASAARKFVELAQSNYVREFDAFDLDTFPPKVATRFGSAAGQLEELFERAFAQLAVQDRGIDDTLRRMQVAVDRLFDVHDDALDSVLDALNKI